MKNPIVASVKFKREPGYLYFVDGDGDVGRRKRNKGHTPSGPYGENHPNEKVTKVGLKKEPGFWYYIEGNDIRTVRPRNSKHPKKAKK